MMNIKNERYKICSENDIRTNSSIIVKAIDLKLKRDVCLKIVKLDVISKEKVLSEIHATVRLHTMTKSIPIIYDYFEIEDRYIAIVMEWISGTTLEERMSNIREFDFVNCIIEICDVLIIMNKKLHINHKDIKPSNIMIDNKGKSYLIDFNSCLSAPNLIEGTNTNKPPEMGLKSKYVDRSKSDVYMIGIILYEYFTHEFPQTGVHFGKNSRRTEEWDFFKKPIEINCNLDLSISNLIEKCLSYNPKNRYSIDNVKHQLIDLKKKRKFNIR